MMTSPILKFVESLKAYILYVEKKVFVYLQIKKFTVGAAILDTTVFLITFSGTALKFIFSWLQINSLY